MNEKTRQRLESDPAVPTPTQPIDKLLLAEAPAATHPDGVNGGLWGPDHPASCFADD